MKHSSVFKFIFLTVMSAAVAGIFLLISGFALRLPKGVTINGVDVGRKTRAEAVTLVREKIEEELSRKSLAVYGRDKKYVFAYPEIGYKDNLCKLVKKVGRGKSYTADITYYLNGLFEIADAICADESFPAAEPFAVFNTTGEAFTYYEGKDGVRADRLKLIADVRASLSSGFGDVKIAYKPVYRRADIKDVKYNTRLLSSFTTYFDGSNAPRAHNIRLAAASVNGVVLKNGDVFSFNGVVGARTRERGFRSAKIIEGGEFVEGIGGGVCQVSTTLYNAALLSGCRIDEHHPHSLAVSYVAPSRDAMVSGNSFDLKFTNVTGFTLYFRARTGENFVAIDIYGRGDGAEYSFASIVTGSLPAPVDTTDDSSLVRDGKDGILSEGYLTVTRNGIKKTTLYRRDKYLPVKRVELASETGAEEQTPTAALV